jgi:hypothetical protein
VALCPWRCLNGCARRFAFAFVDKQRKAPMKNPKRTRKKRQVIAKESRKTLNGSFTAGRASA